MPDDGRTVAPDGLVVIDKSAGWTSHDVVAKVRRLAGTRKVGHAGTLDPMATGVLICGVGRATRLLGYLSGNDKSYSATVRLGQSTVTDDAEGEVTGASPASHVTEDAVRATVTRFVGQLSQVPSSVSAVKVDGKRSYARVRAGEEVHLEPRTVTIAELTVREIRRPEPDLLDVDIVVSCSSGTYIRALGRDIGQELGVGGHLTALRRTRIGGVDLAVAKSIEQLERSFEVVSLADAVRRSFPSREVGDDEATAVRHGRPIAVSGESGVVGVFDADGAALALMEPRGEELRVVVGFIGA